MASVVRVAVPITEVAMTDRESGDGNVSARDGNTSARAPAAAARLYHPVHNHDAVSALRLSCLARTSASDVKAPHPTVSQLPVILKPLQQALPAHVLATEVAF